MNSIQEIQEEIVDEFALFDEWMDKYEHIIELGKDLPIIEDKYKTDENLIKGCQSKVWLHAELVDGKINFTADSDAIITKGVIALVIRAFSNQTPQDIAASDANFIDEIGLKEHLSPTRSNGLLSMLKQIKMYALVYHSKFDV
ncbi:MAG: SufE family protein [Flavobacteriales bacterium]|nr:SufE family protein [Flavobacteriales bacterium]